MKVSDIKTASYVKVENISAGLHISPIHLYADCSFLNGARSDRGRLVTIDPAEAAACLSHFLLEGLRVCERCGERAERIAREGIQ